jgi:hypothetical protein
LAAPALIVTVGMDMKELQRTLFTNKATHSVPSAFERVIVGLNKEEKEYIKKHKVTYPMIFVIKIITRSNNKTAGQSIHFVSKISDKSNAVATHTDINLRKPL